MKTTQPKRKKISTLEETERRINENAYLAEQLK